MDFSNRYILIFSLVLCLACSMAVSLLAVGLKERQDANKLLDRRTNVLGVAGLIEAGEKPTAEEVATLFEEIETLVIDRRSGEILSDVDADTVDPLKEAKDPAISTETPKAFAKSTQVKRLPDRLVAYRVNAEGHECLVFPIHGNGLWSTLYGFLAVKPDLEYVAGITYYEHGETPGLGGEVENPRWKGQWPGKRLLDAEGNVVLSVVKAGAVQDEQTEIDGMSGATITSRSVSSMIELWLGDEGYGPFLDQLRKVNP